MNRLYAHVTAHCQSLNRRHLFLAGVLSVADWAISWLLVAAWNAWIHPIQETTAVILFFLLLPLVFGLWIWLYRRHAPDFRLDPVRLSLRIERVRPELNDVLVTATELQSLRKDTQPNPLETHVLEDAASRLEGENWKAQSTHPLEKPLTCILALLGSAAALSAALLTEPMAKFGHGISDLLQGAQSGIRFIASPNEVPRADDAEIAFAIHRWDKRAWLEWRSETVSGREQVVVTANGKGSFTLYGLTENTRYRVLTPSLRSEWRSIEVYDPAALVEVELAVSPPAYSKLEKQSHAALRDLRVLEGSEIALRLSTRFASSANLLLGQRDLPLLHEQLDRFSLKFPATRSDDYRLRLGDAQGRLQFTASYQLQTYPDTAPVVEILEPTNDAVLAPDQRISARVYAADDFGLARASLHLKLSGKPEVTFSLPLDGADAPPEADLVSEVDLSELDAADGELLTLFAQVTDNKTPEAQTTRSDLVFVEIRTPVPPVEQEGMPMPQQEIDFRTIIDEQKRLLRETYRTDALTEAERDVRIEEIATSLEAVAGEIQAIYRQLEPDLLAAQRRDLIQLFDQALVENRKAIMRLEAGNTAPSVEPQSTSLSALLKLENALRQNTFTREPREGEGKGKSGQGKPPEQQQAPSFESDIQSLKDAKEQIQDLVSKQNQLNSRFERASGGSWEDAGRDASEQQEQARETQDLGRDLVPIPDTGRLRSLLSDAQAQMEDAAGRARQAQAQGSLGSGLRAREALRRAESEVDGLIAEAAGRQLEAAARAASQLASEQAQAAGASAQATASPGAPENDLPGQEATQRSLKDRYEELLDALSRQARETSRLSPQAGQAMREAARQGREAGTASDMERAANALLYGQPGMANPLQESAAQQLRALAEALSEARSGMAGNPMARAQELNRQMQTTLEELASYARQPDSAPEGRLGEIREDWSKRLEELQGITNDRRLGGYANRIGQPQQGDWHGELAEARMILFESSRILRSFLFEASSATGLQFNREAAPPPDRYREEVEDYFRRLANEPEEETE